MLPFSYFFDMLLERVFWDSYNKKSFLLQFCLGEAIILLRLGGLFVQVNVTHWRVRSVWSMIGLKARDIF